MTERNDWGNFYLGLYLTLAIGAIAALCIVALGGPESLTKVGVGAFVAAVAVALDYKYRIHEGQTHE